MTPSELVITVVLHRYDLYQKLPRPHDFAIAYQNRFNNAVDRRTHRVLHLHGFENDQRIAGRNPLPDLDHDLQHLPRHRRIGRTLLRGGLPYRMSWGPFDYARSQRRMDIQFIARLGDLKRPLNAIDLDSNNAGRAIEV